ncbi:MAG: Gfo/Idh/MocA family oxidoreductase [Clostridia bacterium]|nr:Gfo/Idh/MocA family oxidoreductase [Clostridia bacterium]
MNIAFAGLRHAHIFGLYDRAKAAPGVAVTGAWEADEPARTAAQKLIAEPFYAAYDDLLADPRVEAVAVGDYYGIRGQRVIRALEAGKNVIADKPLCASLDELDAIRRLALEKKLKVACMLDLRYDGAVRMARQLARSGRLGPVHAVNFTGQHPLDWGSRPMWYFEEGKHGGTINDIAIHGVDAARYVTGLELKRPVAARTWNAFARAAKDFRDCAQFMAEFDGGAGVTGDVSYSAQSGTAWKMPSYWRFNIWGEEAAVEFRYGGGHLLLAEKGRPIEEIACLPVEENWLTDFMKPYDETALLDVLASQEAALRIQKLADESSEKGSEKP